MEKGKRLAVLVGCNYPNTKNELSGCINDVLAMKEVLIKQFGFDPNNIELMRDDQPGSLTMPTGGNIKKAIGRMVDQAKPGDVLFFHYSGHGTQFHLGKSGYHQHRKHEAIVPCDFNFITDVDFRHLVNCLPEGASFTMLSDSCHSGGLIDKEREQIGGPSKPTDQTTSRSHNPKTIPFESILEQLSSQTGLNTPDIGTHLLEIFGTDASLLFCSTRLELDSIRHLKPDEGILLSGCQASETSADVPHNNGVKAHGAFSYAVQVVLNENLGPLSNKEVVIRVRDLLQALNFEQHPCLYCSDENADAVFLGKPESASI